MNHVSLTRQQQPVLYFGGVLTGVFVSSKDYPGSISYRIKLKTDICICCFYSAIAFSSVYTDTDLGLPLSYIKTKCA